LERIHQLCANPVSGVKTSRWSNHPKAFHDFTTRYHYSMITRQVGQLTQTNRAATWGQSWAKNRPIGAKSVHASNIALRRKDISKCWTI